MKMSKEQREWWRVQVEGTDPKNVMLPIARSQLRAILDDLDEAEKERDAAIAKRNEYSSMYVDMELEMLNQKDYREMAEEDVGRWKKVVDLACGSGCHTLHRHDGMNDDQLMGEFYSAAQRGDLHALEAALGIKKEGV